jgi:hypothetical protein
VTAIDLTSISAEEFVEKRIDFAILVLDRDPMRCSGELFEPISHAGGDPEQTTCSALQRLRFCGRVVEYARQLFLLTSI